MPFLHPRRTGALSMAYACAVASLVVVAVGSGSSCGGDTGRGDGGTGGAGGSGGALVAVVGAGAGPTVGSGGADACGHCASGVCEESSGMCATNCFGGGSDPTNLHGMSAFEGVVSPGGIVCDPDNVLDFEDVVGSIESAGLASSTDGAVEFGGQSVSACLVVDLEQVCLTSEDVGVFYSQAPTQSVCGDEGGTVCNSSNCPIDPGHAALYFAALDLDDPRFLFEAGSCGPSYSFGAPTPLTAWVAAADLEAVRYLIVCRSGGCGAGDSNVNINALQLAYRP